MNEPRRFEVEVEVPGTPEQVWEAIATGPGISSWFMPIEIEGREGGAVSMDFGAGFEEAGTITAWDPPRRFVSEERDSGNVTEWLVEARSGGTCVVRLVTSSFGEGADWEDELESTREGWEMFFHNLRLYLTDFRGQASAQFAIMEVVDAPLEAAWAQLREALELPDATTNDRVTTGDGAPALAGVVDRVLDAELHIGLMLRIDEPAPGLALVIVNAFRGRVYANVAGYLFGDHAQAIAERVEPEWKAWASQRLPARRPA